MDITINYANLYGIVERSLSIIAKRSVDDQGNPLFDNITLGSRETEIVSDFIKTASVDLATETSAFITASTDNSITLTFPTNHNAALEDFIQKACDGYCVSYALYSWLTVTAPRLAEKYQGDYNRNLSAVIRLVNDKKAPGGTTDVLATSTTVTETQN